MNRSSRAVKSNEFGMFLPLCAALMWYMVRVLPSV
jgi:hypothetical protein